MPEGTTYHVYFLGGQSNMDGYGYVDDLGPDEAGPHDAIRLFAGNSVPDGDPRGGRGLWAPLGPGFGLGFTSDGDTNYPSNRFGPELTFGLQIAGLRPDHNIAIIKYSRGGSSLSLDAPNYGTWHPDFGDGNNQYDNALTALRTAFAAGDIDNDGTIDQLVPAGIVWMQGESDAINEGPALVYEQNLERMMGLLRAAMRVDDLPVVIGRITDSGMDEDGKVMDYIELVQAAQAAWVASDACAAYVTEIDDYEHSEDAWHYVSESYLRMGRAFAEAMHALQQRCGRSP